MSDQLRTLDVKSTSGTIVKPGELVDVVEVTPLTLNDRKIYNLLVDNAKQDIAKPVLHSIDKEALRLSRKSDERVDSSIMRLMGAIAHIKTKQNGESATLRVQLLGKNIEHERNDGKFYYSFDPDLRDALNDSTVFARLKKNVMLSFKGKYGLALYEMVEKRINMNKSQETFSVQEFRNLLGVPKNKLTTWYNLRTRAIEPAQMEVNQLSPTFRVEIEGKSTPGKGREITHILLKWWHTSSDGQDESVKELTYSKQGRKARRNGTVEQIVDEQQPKLSHLLSDQAIETARNILINRGYREGVQQAIIIWEEKFQGQAIPENPNGAFIQFCRKIFVNN
ncbi:replication initiation protein [Aquimarina macrocephali]|uniref:replication initiation protein n=1 Tax=Aquimarina macrocephali TaxID=666563 RepID=UPI0004657C63|nr:replication initiation protein [Aquimarina macrocephali]